MDNNLSNKVQIWTDGSVSRKNNNKCSWAFLCKLNGNLIKESYDELREPVDVRTGNRAEMTAIIESLMWLDKVLTKADFEKGLLEIEIFSDSEYCVLGINEWIHNWRSKFYQNVKNKDLWKKFYDLAYKNEYRSTKFIWVRGHSGVEENERVDVLCKKITVGQK